MLSIIFSSFWLFSVATLLLWITSTQGQELSRRKTSNVCKTNSDCPMNAYCEEVQHSTNGLCVCHTGYIIIQENGHKECFKAATTINDDCTYNEQCMITLSTESECVNERCQCKEDTHYVKRENSCYKTSRIGDFCRLRNNCINEEAVCRSGVCQCPYGKHSSRNMKECIFNVELGEKCTMDEECVTDNTRCLDICRCKASHILNKNGDKCLKVGEFLHDDCDEDHQCTERIPYSVCSTTNLTCECKEGYHELKHKCWVSVPLGGICEVNENCIPYSETLCIDEHCSCREGFKPLNGYCSFSLRVTSSQRIFALIFLIYLFMF